MLKNFVTSFVALFVALDVIGIVPLYLSLMRHSTLTDRKKILNTSMWTAVVVAIVFIFLGQWIFKLLGIEISDFKIAGGIVLLLLSLAELLGGREIIQKTSGSTGVVPLAVPLITGPAVLTTLLLGVDTFGYAITLLSICTNYMLAWFVLKNSHWITKIIGNDGTVVFSKIAALLLAAIAVAMIRSGIVDVIRTHIPYG